MDQPRNPYVLSPCQLCYDMRAERLMAIALLQQAHRRLTAPELARRLDVSEQTIRRDLDALLLSGLWLYSERGRGGGWALLDSPAINLSALTSEEAQALFLVTGPALLAGRVPHEHSPRETSYVS